MARYTSIFPALLGIESDETPIFIPTFNQPTLLKMTLNQLNSAKNRIIIYDNNSTSVEMRSLLEDLSSDIDVILSEKNTGPRIFTEDAQILSLMPNYFVVTDPDLIHNENLPENHLVEMRKIIESRNLAKAGFAIEIYDEEEQNRFVDLKSVLEWEEPYWQDQDGQTSTKDRVYKAWIDTTYSLNRRDACIYHSKFKKPTFRYPSVRIADSYTCKHIGWWRKDLMPSSAEETNLYLETQKWSHTENYYYKGLG